MIYALGSTTPITLGPFVNTSGALVTSTTPTVQIRVNGAVLTPIPGNISAVGADGCATYTPAGTTDTGTAGEIVILAILAGAIPYWRKDQVGTLPTNMSGKSPATLAAADVSGQLPASIAPLAITMTAGSNSRTLPFAGTVNGYPAYSSTGQFSGGATYIAWNVGNARYQITDAVGTFDGYSATLIGAYTGTTSTTVAPAPMLPVNAAQIGGTTQSAGRDLGTVLPATALNNAPAITLPSAGAYLSATQQNQLAGISALATAAAATSNTSAILVALENISISTSSI